MEKKIVNKHKGFTFPIIDITQTGQRIKSVCTSRGYSVKRLQELLQIGARQSIYDWYNGKTLPSLDNLLALSRLFKVPIEDFIVCKKAEDSYAALHYKHVESDKRAEIYYRLIMRTNL